jgi:hypothetical protein
MSNSLIWLSIAALLFAAGGVFIRKARRGRPSTKQRQERLSIDRKLKTTNELMKGVMR